MKAWNHDPRKFLLMHLKLVKGVQFSNPLGEILVSIPNLLEATIVTKWQYRMMLSLDGEMQFVEVVRDVKAALPGEFAASDVWMFLDWLIEKDLVEEDNAVESGSGFDSSPRRPDLIASPSTTRTFLKVPLQIFAVLLLCGATVLGTYTATPILIAMLNNDAAPVVAKPAVVEDVAEPVEVASVEVATVEAAPAEESVPEIAETQAVRIPKVAEPQEVTFAAEVPVNEAPALIEGPSLIEKLIGMRQEMAACQIRRDEYYLLDDEKGYSTEVVKISELVKEIGQIRADISE